MFEEINKKLDILELERIKEVLPINVKIKIFLLIKRKLE